MPIEFAPPSPNLQGFNVTPPQYTDPLQTLAQMGQLRTQNLQQQTAGMQLEQERMKLDSSKSLMDAMVNGGGDFEKTFKIATQPGSKVLPADLIGLRQHYTQMQQEAANLDKTTRDNTAAGIDQYRGLLNGVQTPDDLAAANARADQMAIPKTVPRHTQFSDPAHVQAFSNGLATQAQILKEATERETAAREKAQAGLAGVQTTEAEQKVATGERQAAIAEIQAATNPATGVPNPADWAAIQQRHPKVQLPPGTPTPDTLAAFVRSAVPAEKIPEFDINAMKAKLGLMGNTEFDQYQLRFAQSIHKKPSELNFEDTQKLMQLYAKDKQDPSLLTAVLGLKSAQQAMASAQVAALPSDAELNAEARDYRNLDMSPGRIAAMREGRISYFPQILQKAREQAAAEGQPFSPATLEAKYDTWLNTEKNFASGGQEASMIRGFENLMRHTGLLWKAKDALTKNDYPLMKTIANSLGVASGSDAKTTYDTIAGFVADEAAKAFLPGGGGESERAQKLSRLNADLGTTQISSNIKGLMELADSQRQTLEREYAEGTFGKGPRIGRLFSNDALANRDLVLGKKAPAGRPGATAGATAGKINVKAGDGSIHPFDTEAQAKKFEDAVKAAGGTTSRQ